MPRPFITMVEAGLVLAGLLAFALVAMVAGPLPSDLALTHAVQGVLPFDADWTVKATNPAKIPSLVAVLLGSSILCVWLAGWRGRRADWCRRCPGVNI